MRNVIIFYIKKNEIDDEIIVVSIIFYHMRRE